MGHFERQADQHAEELGRLSVIEDRVERDWYCQRERLAEQLTNRQPIVINGDLLLDFDDVIDRICGRGYDGLRAALLLSLTDESLGGKPFRLLIEREALNLVEDFAPTLKTALEKDHE